MGCLKGVTRYNKRRIFNLSIVNRFTNLPESVNKVPLKFQTTKSPIK